MHRCLLTRHRCDAVAGALLDARHGSGGVSVPPAPPLPPRPLASCAVYAHGPPSEEDLRPLPPRAPPWCSPLSSRLPLIPRLCGWTGRRAAQCTLVSVDGLITRGGVLSGLAWSVCACVCPPVLTAAHCCVHALASRLGQMPHETRSAPQHRPVRGGHCARRGARLAMPRCACGCLARGWPPLARAELRCCPPPLRLPSPLVELHGCSVRATACCCGRPPHLSLFCTIEPFSSRCLPTTAANTRGQRTPHRRIRHGRGLTRADVCACVCVPRRSPLCCAAPAFSDRRCRVTDLLPSSPSPPSPRCCPVPVLRRCLLLRLLLFVPPPRACLRVQADEVDRLRTRR